MRLVLPTLLCLMLAACGTTTTSTPPVPATPAVPAAPATAFNAPPTWAERAIWYQIFPERFRNGDPGNDPTAADIRGSWPMAEPKAWQIKAWTGDWFAVEPWEKANLTPTTPGFYNPVHGYRRYGGDLQGVIDKLGYLADTLGVTALYLNPVFPSPSLHKYDEVNYHHIDPTFGPTPAADRAAFAAENPVDPQTWTMTGADRLFVDFVQKAHAKGLKVIIDGVFNHLGLNSFAFQDVRRRGQSSPYATWFKIERFDDPVTPADEFKYSGWYGVETLPELRDTPGADGVMGTNNGKVDDDDLDPGARAYILASVRRWMDPNGDGDPSDGIDGWRLDAADMVGMGFWRDFRKTVRGINPNAYLTGEVWWQDWGANKMFNPAPWLTGDTFDGAMNYRWADAVLHAFNDSAKAIPMSELARRLAALRSETPGHVESLQNLFDSHDTDRLASRVVNPDYDFDHKITPGDSPTYDVRKPNAAEWAKVRQLVALQFTQPGAPMIYYGAEAGMWGGDDPDERKPMLWREFTYADETAHPLPGHTRPRDANRFDPSLFSWYRQMIALRKRHPALQTGRIEVMLTDDARKLYGFRRENGSETVLCLFNGSDKPQPVQIPTDGVYQDELNGLTRAPGGGSMLPARGVAVLVRE